MIVLRNGFVADAEGAREADVGIDGERIVAVGDVDDAEEELDVSGSVVAPGLVDAHVHLQFDGPPDPSAAHDRSPAELALTAASTLRKSVEAGVTTVRDLGSRAGVSIAAREAVREGTVAGPRVRAAGQNIVMTGGHGHWFGREADGPAEARKAAREQLKAGADVVKCMATGGVLTRGAQTGMPELIPEELAAIVDAAGAKNVPTAAHAHGDRGIRNAVEAGITSVEHGTFMSRETAVRLAETDTYWVPTVSALHGIVENGVDAGIPAEVVAKAEEAGDHMDEAFEHALEAGVTVAMGTDAGTPFNYHGDNAAELEYMVEMGMDHDHAFEAATANAAELVGIDDVGSVREGTAADLVVLPDDPRENVAAYQDPEAVFARGERVV